MLRAAPVVIIAALAAAAPAGAAMTVGTFVTRANALRAQGIAAMLSPDFQVLREEARTAKADLKALNARRLAQRKPPIACVPEGETIGIEEMLDRLDALPASARKLPLSGGYALVFAAKFPCR